MRQERESLIANVAPQSIETKYQQNLQELGKMSKEIEPRYEHAKNSVQQEASNSHIGLRQSNIDEFKATSQVQSSQYQAKIKSGENKLYETADSLAAETSRTIEVGEHNAKREVLLHPLHEDQNNER